jgi:hypothetical protein
MANGLRASEQRKEFQRPPPLPLNTGHGTGLSFSAFGFINRMSEPSGWTELEPGYPKTALGSETKKKRRPAVFPFKFRVAGPRSASHSYLLADSFPQGTTPMPKCPAPIFILAKSTGPHKLPMAMSSSRWFLPEMGPRREVTNRVIASGFRPDSRTMGLNGKWHWSCPHFFVIPFFYGKAIISGRNGAFGLKLSKTSETKE